MNCNGKKKKILLFAALQFRVLLNMRRRILTNFVLLNVFCLHRTCNVCCLRKIDFIFTIYYFALEQDKKEKGEKDVVMNYRVTDLMANFNF